ncbi:MAG: hypothetical protein AAF298_06955 [Cyanobacteria bacterium P01_A01_bin.40]
MICAIGIFHHEMWRDELEAWLLARDSVSITNLLENLKYTGHPALWYLCLYVLAKITPNPTIIQFLQLVIATGIVLIVVYYGKFTKLQKALFCFGYFPLYEYGVISRSYGLGVLLIFSFCALFCSQNRNFILIAISLGLLAHTSIYGFIFAFTFALLLMLMGTRNRDERQKLLLSQKNLKSKLVIAAAIYLFCMSTAMLQMIPPSNASYKGNLSVVTKQNKSKENKVNSTSNQKSAKLSPVKIIERTSTSIWRSYVPIPDVSQNNIWGSNFISDNNNFPEIASLDSASLITASFSLIWLIVFGFIFRHSYQAFWVYILGNFIMIIFSFVVKVPEIRHYGHLFILLIACYWIYNHNRYVQPSLVSLTKLDVNPLTRNFCQVLLTTILFIHLCAGIMMYSVDLVRPFSNSQKVAQFIRENQWENSVIVGSKDVYVSPLSAWLNKKIYYPETESFDTFTVWTSQKNKKSNQNLSPQDILHQIETLKEHHSENILLVLDQELKAKIASIDTKLLVSYEDAIALNENYYVYSVD